MRGIAEQQGDRGEKVELLGRRLRKLRKERKWSPADLGERSGLDAQDVIRIERGEVRLGLETVFRLLAALGVEPAEFERLAAAERQEPPSSERFRRDLSC
jgi:transcriptional regulator with XRE-family HTH domain